MEIWQIVQLAGSHLVISALNNKCVSLAAHNVDLGDEEAVDVPVGEEYNKFFWFSNI